MRVFEPLAARSPLWRNSGFLHLWAAQAASTLGTRIGREALLLTAIMALGATPVDMALLNLATALPYLVFGLLAGTLVDRWRRRRILIAADLARALLLISVPLAVWADVFTLAQLIAVVLAVTTCSLWFDVAHQAFLPMLVPRDLLVDANAKQEAVSASAEIIGPPIGGLIVRVLGAPIAVLVDAISYVLSALFLARLPHVETPRGEDAPRLAVRHLKVGFSLLWRHRLFRPLLLAKLCRGLFGGTVGAFYALYVFGDLHLNAFELGLVVGTGGLAALVAAMAAPWLAQRMPAGPAMLVGFAMAAIGTAMIPLAGSLEDRAATMTTLIAGQLIGDFGLTFALTMERALRQHHFDEALLGRITAAITIVGNAPAPLGAILGGLAAERVGLSPVLWAAAFGYAAGWFVLYFSPLRRLPGMSADALPK